MTIYGASIGGAAKETIATQDARYGFVPAIRYFTPGMPGALPTGSSGREIWYSFKCSTGDFTGMAAGNYDTAIKTWLKGLPAGQKVKVTYYHEPEGNWPSGSSFAKAQDHFINLVHSTTGVVAIVEVWIIFTGYIITYGHAGGSKRNIDDYWPTTYVPDGVGADMDGVVVSSAYPTVFPTWAGYWNTFATGKGIPWAVTEFGNGAISTDTTHTGRAAWLTSTAGSFASNGATYVLLWDDNDPNDHYNDDHLTTTNEINAWKALVGASISAPTGVAATSNTAGTTITMTWAANPVGDSITGWNVYLGNGYTTTLVKQNSTALALTPRSYTFTGLTPGTKYSCAVVALNAGTPGKSGYSTIQNITTSVPGPTNHAPVIDYFTATPNAANPLQIDFASHATDPDGTTITSSIAVTYGGVTQTISSANGNLTFNPPGTGTAVLSVSDGTLVTKQTVTFAVSGAPASTVNFGWDLSAHKPEAPTQGAPASLLGTLIDVDAQVAALMARVAALETGTAKTGPKLYGYLGTPRGDASGAWPGGSAGVLTTTARQTILQGAVHGVTMQTAAAGGVVGQYEAGGSVLASASTAYSGYDWSGFDTRMAEAYACLPVGGEMTLVLYPGPFWMMGENDGAGTTPVTNYGSGAGGLNSSTILDKYVDTSAASVALGNSSGKGCAEFFEYLLSRYLTGGSAAGMPAGGYPVTRVILGQEMRGYFMSATRTRGTIAEDPPTGGDGTTGAGSNTMASGQWDVWRYAHWFNAVQKRIRNSTNTAVAAVKVGGPYCVARGQLNSGVHSGGSSGQLTAANGDVLRGTTTVNGVGWHVNSLILDVVARFASLSTPDFWVNDGWNFQSTLVGGSAVNVDMIPATAWTAGTTGTRLHPDGSVVLDNRELGQIFGQYVQKFFPNREMVWSEAYLSPNNDPAEATIVYPYYQAGGYSALYLWMGPQSRLSLTTPNGVGVAAWTPAAAAPSSSDTITTLGTWMQTTTAAAG